MPEFIVKARCLACKYEEEEIVAADNPAEAKQSQKHSPRQQLIKMAFFIALAKGKIK
jgi:hypothetical protein